MDNQLQSTDKPRQFPKSVPFIIFYALFERYSSLGVTAVLAIFLNVKLGVSEDTATAIYHYFVFFSYCFGIIGAIIADSWLGRFKTLLFGMSFLGGIGNLLLTIGAIAFLSYLLPAFTYIGLFLISFGVGCLEPNLPAYSGDQFRFPLEEKGFAITIGLLFVMQNLGRVVAIIFSPMIRSNTKCFGADDCYPLIFGIFFAVKIFAIIILVAGKKFAVCIAPTGNMFVKVCGCIWLGFTRKLFSRSKAKPKHWLDYSLDKYGKVIVEDTKHVLRVISLLPPAIIVASLYFQQSSRWVFQSRLMDGTVGNFTIKPEQVPLVNALSVVIFVPTIEYVFNPLMAKVGIRTNLHRVIVGGFLSATAFVIAALVQFQVDRRVEKLHMVWQVPQHMVLALGEVLVYVQMLQFAYTQAPAQMKSVLQAFFAMIIGGGNLIVALIATTRIFDAIAYEFLMFAGIVYLAMIVFTILALRYKLVDMQKVKSDDDENEDEIDKNYEHQEHDRNSENDRNNETDGKDGKINRGFSEKDYDTKL